HSVNINIPTLCYLKGINEVGDCRMCVVEVKGARALMASCVYPVSEGMEVWTNTKKVLDSRKETLRLILSNHEKKCLSCIRSENCELQKLSKDLGIEDDNYFEGERIHYDLDKTSVHLIRDNNKCILCRRCIAACEEVQGIGILGPNARGFKAHVGCAFDVGLGETACVNCGQCIVVCPTGALYEKDDSDKVEEALADPEKYVVVQTAPSVRATIGEEFGLPIGTDCEGKLAAALRRIGFKRVFDTDFAADLTIMEEANEFVERLTKGTGPLPLITSCSPGWVKYCETYHPEFVENVSSCKSPQQMFSAMAKTYYAKKIGVDPKNMFVVSIMPCTAKKFEITRPYQSSYEGCQDTDVALTTRELARMIKRAGIDFARLPNENFDDPLGESTGAAVIFGATGGVMEAALRTAVEWVTGESLGNVDFKEVRGMEGIKEATYNVGGTEVNVAVASGLKNANELLERVKKGEKQYHFIEIMGCPGGCINGGGQPIVPSYIRNFEDYRSMRASALYKNDGKKTIRKSHENESIKKLYSEFLGEPGSEIAHHLLHTKYVERPVNPILVNHSKN
ncbi:MAG: iron hydrogenase small subunit, partial [Lachnospiraceae bacterium]|nr:iron hydrogenase small subunit [Lachnospiraceae bacterium]